MPPETGSGGGPDGPQTGQQRGPSRRTLLRAGAAGGAVLGAGGLYELVRWATSGGPSAPTGPETRPQTFRPLLMVENGQIVEATRTGKQVIGIDGDNAYNLLNGQGCAPNGTPQPVTYKYQKEVLESIKAQGKRWVRTFAYQNIDTPPSALSDLMGIAKDLDMFVILTLSGNGNDGCGESSKGPNFYAGGYNDSLKYADSVETALLGMEGGNRVILELANETGGELPSSIDQTTVNNVVGYLSAGAGTIHRRNPKRLVAASFQMSNGLVQNPQYFEQVLGVNGLQLVDLHFYPGNPLPDSAVRQAISAGKPPFLGEIGVDSTSLQQYISEFDGLDRMEGFAGGLGWGEQQINGQGKVIYDTNDGHQWGHDSKTEEMMGRFTRVWEQPTVNTANRAAGIS